MTALDTSPPPPAAPQPGPAPIRRKHAKLWTAVADALEPFPEMSPAEFARRYRKLHKVYCVERPGAWDSSYFPYQDPVMNTVEEAVKTGKRGVVFMKAGQIGGTDAMINAALWLKMYLPGPQMFMTSTDKVAREFSRDRFDNIIPDMEPLRKKYIPNARGDVDAKRFIDGMLKLCGGQSIFNFQTTPFRVVVLDELDSLTENLAGMGDPLRLAENRTDSYSGQTLMIAYAHPSNRDHGVGKLYYEASDQRRGFVRHDCGHEFYLKWDDVRCIGVTGEEKTPDHKDPDAYHYVCPGCGGIIDDAARSRMLRGIVYKSTLEPHIAKKKQWIGVQAGQLYCPFRSLRALAVRWIDSEADQNTRRVFVNRTMGETYEANIKSIAADDLRRLIVIQRRPGDPEFYSKGQVPPGVVFLTAGQDSRATELHYSVWGWGLRQAVDGVRHLCGWLIDWGIVIRAHSMEFSESEFHVFDDLLYRRKYFGSQSGRPFMIRQAGHDIGWSNTQLPIIRYCANWPTRAIPVKGAALTPTSASAKPYASWGSAFKHRVTKDIEKSDDATRHLMLNTFMLKSEWFGWTNPKLRFEINETIDGRVIGRRSVAHLAFPEDVDDQWLTQSRNEALKPGKKSGEEVWTRIGPNHFSDTNTMALGIAHNLEAFLGRGKPGSRKIMRPDVPRRPDRIDPAMG